MPFPVLDSTPRIVATVARPPPRGLYRRGRGMKRVNDIGGEDWGPVPLDEAETPAWALLSTALRGALGDRGAGLVSLHEARRAREDLGRERYHALGYFELGTQAMHDVLVEKGVVTAGEVAGRIAELRRRRA